MRSWALPLLRCPDCRGSEALCAQDAALACPGCGGRFPVRDGITDFLAQLNSVAARERDAVAGLDAGEPAGELLRELLVRLDAETLEPSHRDAYPCLRHAEESRAQIVELLRSHPLPAGSTVVELGADHCWASSLLLDGGCRVIAVDITDHMRLASRADDADLVRINADMNRLPVADAAVDVVWATAAAHHSWDLGLTFREAARVTRPGGSLVFCCEPMPSWPRWVVGGDFGAEERELGINETWIPRGRWLRLCAEAGFRPRLVFPRLTEAELATRLRRRHLPARLGRLLRPLLPPLQVSIHLVAERA